MKIKTFVAPEFCEVAIAHALANRNRIKSFTAFREAIETYLSSYGHLCIDDHEGECSSFMPQAKILVEQYYKN